MAASLSENDFQCLQNQMLEQKSKIYSLEEKNMKYYNELKQAHLHEESLRNELAKLQKTLNRSKNAREIDHLLQENKSLQDKLQSQEDEFRLQNQTLMQEIGNLTLSMKEIQKELELAKSVENTSVEKEIDSEFLRLQAENLALLKKLKQSDNIDTNIEDVKLKKEIEIEENLLLRNKLQEAQTLHKEELHKLQTEIENLTEKLKKKQKSLTQLHEEKEKMYSEFQVTLKNAQSKNAEEIQHLKDLVKKLEHQKHVTDERTSSFNEENLFDEHEAKVEFSGDKASFEYSLNDTRLHLKECEEKVEHLTEQLDQSQAIVKTLEEEKLQLLEQLQISAQEQEKLNIAIKEITDVAEKRKIHMEEMNKHMLEISDKHSKEIGHLTEQLTKEQDAFKVLFEKEKETKIQLIEKQNEVNRLKSEVERLKKDHSSTSVKLTDIEKLLEENKESFEKQLEELKTEHQKSMKNVEDESKALSENLNIQLEVTKAEKFEFEEKVQVLEQEIKDLNDEKKIIEKKNVSMVKDLKRQLYNEQKRADKLQERLQEVLNEQNRSVEEILQSSHPSDKSKGDISSISSWSYVSADAADREIPSHSDGSSCGRDSPNQSSPITGTLENETTNLIKKVAYLQQKSSILEEKVNHLELSNEALVDDVLKKTAIIQFYCMEGRSNAPSAAGQDKLTIKRIVDFIKDKGDENLREVNRKMQRMLEETLTKNMHLQKDIETLSNEVSRLSKIVQSPVDQNLQSAVFIDGI